MKKICFRMLIAVLLVSALAVSAGAADLIPVGKTIGLNLDAEGVTVVDFQKDGGSPGKDAGLNVGDVILKVDDRELHSGQQLQKAVQEGQEPLELLIRRKGQEKKLTVAHKPGQPLGIFVRDGITGIGTVTYYDPATGVFGALGHGVNTADGELVEMERGTAMVSSVVEVKRGQEGQPGQLRGAFSRSEIVGTLTANTKNGLFGKTNVGWNGKPVPVAEMSEIITGPAEILSNVSGTEVGRYQVEIVKLYSGDRANGRNILLTVTDPVLLEKTGGIVQGMSGSPILQDGKLIGAVTHVLVNDPTCGYGIFIENMLEAAG